MVEQTGNATAHISSASNQFKFRKDDVISLGVLALGFILILCLVPPARTFPITDDWIYAGAVGDLLRWDYHPPLQSQANLLSHAAWGALFALVLGESYTALTVATLIASVACLIGLYLLLRHLGVSSRLALLGTATLGFNPIYLYLSYSFMTDITFLACWVSAGLFFLRGFQGHGEHWLWLGSVMAALAYLTRQPGVILVVAALVYLLWARKWTLRSALAVGAIPLVAAIAYALWERTQPSTVLSGMLSQMVGEIIQNPVQFLWSRAPSIGLLINGLGFFLLPVLRLPRKLLLVMPLFILFAALIFLNTHVNGSAFLTNGNILDRTGFVLWNYAAAPLWSEPAWALIAISSGFILAIYAASLVERVRHSSTLKRRKGQAADPAFMLYTQAALMSGFVFLVTPVLYDRYMLPILPLLMIPALRSISTSERAATPDGSRRRMLLRYMALALMVVFSITCLRDYMEHATTRWRAANLLAERGIPRGDIDAGFEWQGLYWELSGATGEIFSIRPNISYKVSDLPLEGYRVIGSLPYSSWLSGGETRYVLMLGRERPAGVLNCFSKGRN